MPTAIATITHNGSTHISLKTVVLSPDSHKPSSHSLPHTGSTATLRTLYNRATRAFLHRDIHLTYTLLDAAFAILQPPPTSTPDIFAVDRRKWDILRITLESTVYASTHSQEERSTLPDSLQASLLEAPHALVSKLYTRSLALFTPADSVLPSANATYVPSQVLATLVLASLRADCAETGKGMIEDWLAHREPSALADEGPENEDGYAKILDLYCLHVLPKLQQWDYASDFLDYESELPTKTRERFKSHLRTLHVQSLASRSPSQSSRLLDASDSRTPRPYSPSSSSSSSLSTTSTHTIVPSSLVNGRTPVRPRSTSSTSSKSDATARAVPRSSNPRIPLSHVQNGHARPAEESRARSKSRTASSTASAAHPTILPRAPPPITQSTDVSRVNTYALIKAAIQPYLTTSRLATLFLLLVVLPLASWLLRRRRKAARLGGGGGVLLPGSGSGSGVAGAVSAVTNAELVRRRLGGVEAGLVGRVWGEVIRAVTDTVKMAGSGLV